jgi:DNA helicase II / ATP-dependent DNA helicase PcrA
MPATPSGAPLPKAVKKSKTHSASNQGLKRTIKSEPPPIAADIPYVSAFAIGDHVSHVQFGEGSVTEIDGAKLTINFASRGTKQIVDYYVSLPKK